MEGVDVFIVACHFCGGEFEAKTARKKWCSFNCNSLARGFDCTDCGVRMHASPSKADRPQCRKCRRVNGHGEAGYYRGCRCDVCRSGKAAAFRAYAARRKAEGRPLHRSKPTVPATCLGRSGEFQARKDLVKAGRGKFCSADCHNDYQTTGRAIDEATRERWLREGKRGSVRWRALRRAKAALELSGGNRVFVNGPCLVCGLEFTAPGQLARYCSKDCRSMNSRSGTFGLSFLDRMFLFARDEWKCHLCGLEVVYGVDDYDPRMATLDHLVPQSLGGGHEFENLATAHLLCNSIRRELPVEEFRSGEAVAMLRQRLADSMGVAA